MQGSHDSPLLIDHPSQILVIKRPSIDTLSSRPVLLRKVPSLDHELRDDPMEGRIFVGEELAGGGRGRAEGEQAEAGDERSANGWKAQRTAKRQDELA
jgi:hypothetical protein